MSYSALQENFEVVFWTGIGVGFFLGCLFVFGVAQIIAILRPSCVEPN